MSRVIPAILGGLVLLSACSSGESAPATDAAGDYMPLLSVMEAGEIMQQCMTDEGWEVELNEFGEISSDYPADEADQYSADLEACWAEHGLDKPPPPMDSGTAGEFFDLMVASAACLEDLGYRITEPPTREAYVDGMVADGVVIWDPYADIVDLVTSEEWDAARRSCPQPERTDLDG